MFCHRLYCCQRYHINITFIKSHKQYSLINNFKSYSTVNEIKMCSWDIEKNKFLSMNLEEKRKVYSNKRFYKVDDIPNWKTYGKNKNLPPIITLLTNHQIDKNKNNILSEKVCIYKGDITNLEIDAIVNAANKTLLGGGGVDGAIHRAAGPLLKEECRTLNGCNTGEAKITGGYKLPAKYVIHTVGPVGEKPDLLQQCYKNSLQLMLTKNLNTIAFPCISTGVYGYPVRPAAHVAINEVRKFLENHTNEVERVIFCIFLDEDQTIYEGILQSYFPLD